MFEVVINFLMRFIELIKQFTEVFSGIGGDKTEEEE